MLQSGDLVAERYELAGLVGSGGMGTVWKARDVRSDRTVALKRPHAGCGHQERAQLQAEARVADKVSHPNAVRVLEVTDADCWLVMEYVPSRSLAELIAQDGPLPAERVARIGAQVAQALGAAHAAGVVHRDVTPGNVLVGEDDSVKVTDFGISAWREATVTVSGKISGTPGYLAPEVADGRRATAASDVFSLGATLFAALDGNPPFGRGDPAAVLARARTGNVPRCRNAGALEDVLTRLLEPRAAGRPTAIEAAALLAAVTGDALPPAGTSTRRFRPGRRTAVAGSAAGVLVLVTTVVVLAQQDGGDGSGAAPVAVRPVVGDERTADPCALLDVGPLGTFGNAVLDPYQGSLAECDVLIDPRTEDMVDVQVALLPPVDGVSPLPAGQEQDLVVPQVVASSRSCTSILTLGDLNRVSVSAQLAPPLPLTPDSGLSRAGQLCDIAETAVASAVDRLGAGAVPRRAVPDLDVPGSLAGLDACTLVVPADLTNTAGVDGTRPRAGFARWSCAWSTSDDSVRIRVIFERGDPIHDTEVDAMRVGDRQAVVHRDRFGPNSCDVTVAHHAFTDAADVRHEEHLTLVVDGSAIPGHDEQCDIARDVIVPVAARLPAG